MKILQVGYQNWSDSLQPFVEDVKWFFSRPEDIQSFLDKEKERLLAKLSPIKEEEKPREICPHFDAILITDDVNERDVEILAPTIEAYGLFHISGLNLVCQSPQGIFRKKMLRELKGVDKEEIVHFLKRTLFDSQYGAKLPVADMDILSSFQGNVRYNGNVAVDFEGFYGLDYQPLFTYRYNLSGSELAMELWLEYIKVSGDCQIRLEVVPIQKGSLYDLMESMVFEEKELEKPLLLKPTNPEVGFYAITVSAKGTGTLSFGPLHWRYSRLGLGSFVLGGERYHDEKRQEFIYYFNPGDMQPPLNVYFSGYRPAEGFEGFGIMKYLEAPFMLIGDPRLEGGSFYLGTKEFEANISKVIRQSLDYLGFQSSDLILSGLSMGTFGALYYAADLNPYAVVVGKPFTNLGDMVSGMKLRRPDEFETSGDILINAMGHTNRESMEGLNKRFWEKFDQAGFQRTNFAIAYMEQDDYDALATKRLITSLSQKQVHIFTKGYEGRHNDNSQAINRWFMRQYVNLLMQGYGRKYT